MKRDEEIRYKKELKEKKIVQGEDERLEILIVIRNQLRID